MQWKIDSKRDTKRNLILLETALNSKLKKYTIGMYAVTFSIIGQLLKLQTF